LASQRKVCGDFGFRIWDSFDFAYIADGCVGWSNDDIAERNGLNSEGFHGRCAHSLGADEVSRIRRVQERHEENGISVPTNSRFVVGKENCGETTGVLHRLYHSVQLGV